MSGEVAVKAQVEQVLQLLRVAATPDADESLVTLAAQLIDAALKADPDAKLLESAVSNFYASGSLNGALHDQALIILKAAVSASASKMHVKTACEKIEVVLNISGADDCSRIFIQSLEKMAEPGRQLSLQEIAALLKTLEKIYDEMLGEEAYFLRIIKLYAKIAFEPGADLNAAVTAFKKVTDHLYDNDRYDELIIILEQTPYAVKQVIGEAEFRNQLWLAHFLNNDDALAAQMALSDIFSDDPSTDSSGSLIKIARCLIATDRYQEARVILLGLLSFSGERVGYDFDDVVGYLKEIEGRR